MKNLAINLIVMVLSSLTIISCNQEFKNLLKDDYGSSKAETTNNKILLIIVDGVRGAILTDLDPPNFRNLSNNSLFTNNSIADANIEVFNRSVGLTNLMTGYTFETHNVVNDYSTLDDTKAPTFVNRIKKEKSQFYSEAYTTDESFKTNLLRDIDEAKLFKDDAEAVEAFKSSIVTTKSDFVLLHLSNPYRVGESYSYETRDENYKEAISALDRQVGTVINSIQSRSNFTQENWLIILTSSIGGIIDGDNSIVDKTLFSDSKRNTFTYFYSPKISRRFINKPDGASIHFEGYGFRFNNDDKLNAASARLIQADSMNIGRRMNRTLTFFLKFNQNWGWGTENHVQFMAKRRGVDNRGIPGWNLFSWEREVTFSYGLNSLREVKVERITDTKWHAITFVIDSTARKIKSYLDGKYNRQNDFNEDLFNIDPFIIGRHTDKSHYKRDERADYSICNVQMYNVAMNDEEVKKYAALPDINEETSPYYDDLIAYWKFYDQAEQDTITDVIKKSGDLVIYGNNSWRFFSEQTSYIIPFITENTYKIVPNSIDIPFVTMQWFGIIPRPEWELKGQSWSLPYKIFEY
jgi:hypothetical protein